MATYTKANDFVLYLVEEMDVDADTWKFDLCLTAPTAGTDVTADGNGYLLNVSPITYTGTYTDDVTPDRTLESGNIATTQTGGTFTFDYTADIIITASGGSINDWRYIVDWNDTVTSPNADPVRGFWDHGSTISLADTDTATLQFNASGLWTLT